MGFKLGGWGREGWELTEEDDGEHLGVRHQALELSVPPRAEDAVAGEDDLWKYDNP